MHHQKAYVERLCIPKNEGGRRMIQLELSYKTSTIGQHKYFTAATDWMLQLHSVNWGINPHLKTPPLFFAKPPLNLQIVQHPPLFR